MALNKQNINMNFSGGLETKTDPYQVPLGKFLRLQNSVFKKGGLLSKRNGYGALPSLPDDSSLFCTTFNGDLTAIGSSVQALSAGYGQWTNRGTIQPLSLDVLSLIRNNTSQSQIDTAIAPNGLICTVYVDQNPASLSNPLCRYSVSDSVTGQNVIAPTTVTGFNTTYPSARVFLLGSYFLIVFVSQSGPNLQYIAISTNNPSTVTAPVNLSSSITPSTPVSFDGAVINNHLYLAWNGATASGIKMAYLTQSLVVTASINPDPIHQGTLMSVCVDQTTGVIWVSYYDSGSQNGYSLCRDQNLNQILTPQAIITTQTVVNLTTVANNGSLSVFYEVTNAYSYDSGIPTNYIETLGLIQNEFSSVIGSPSVVRRGVGLASKAFLWNESPYFLATYQSPYQSSYFLFNAQGQVLSKLAPSNGRGYLTKGLPSVTVTGNLAQVGYLYKDLVQAVNKTTAPPAGAQTAGVYAQLGCNLASFTFGGENLISAEIGKNLNLSGGIVWAYDGYSVVEQGFHLYPDSIEATWSATGGNIHAQPDGVTNTNAYWYQVTYEWSDNQGNIFRSAPSIPIPVTTTSNGTTGSITVNIPTLRLTYKTANPVKLVVYRWSVAQQVYYQSTTILAPVINNPAVDSIAFVDTFSDATILGNNILYTTGGVLENIGPPALSSVFIFDDRLWGITAEDPNLLWYSKTVLQETPVEMTDLETVYVAPNIGAQGNTGPILCGAQMDDKAIFFKASAMNYLSGTGPDATGSNNQYSQPIFITSTVGCSNPKSIVFMPQGLMFEFQSQSGNQIWILGRDLSTRFIGAPVQGLTQNATIQSAVNIPGTNEVRFTLSSGITLLYDYYYEQWGTFVNVAATSSTVYQGLHTFINTFGQVYQETPGLYLDGSSPVLMSFSTAWFSFSGLQGYQRAYFFTLLATYLSPHLLNLKVGYDYSPNPSTQILFRPSQFSPAFGSDLTFGGSAVFGGSSALEQPRIFFQQQRCQSFQIHLDEVYDPSLGVIAGPGFTMSGINLVFGSKKGFKPFKASQSGGLS